MGVTTTVPRLSGAQARLLRELLYFATSYDTIADEKQDAALSPAVGDQESAVIALMQATADLNSHLAAVAREWVADLPDAAAEGILDANKDASFEPVLERLFAQAGIAERFRARPQPDDEAPTFAPEEPR